MNRAYYHMVWANMNVAQRHAQMINPINFLVNTNQMFYTNNLESNLTQAGLARSLLLSHFISKLKKNLNTKNVADKKIKFKPGKKIYSKFRSMPESTI